MKWWTALLRLATCYSLMRLAFTSTAMSTGKIVATGVAESHNASIKGPYIALKLQFGRLLFWERTWSRGYCYFGAAMIEDFFHQSCRVFQETWPPRSPDLSPVDFFLWGYLKTKVCETNPRSIYELKENIRREMSSITKLTCRAAMENSSHRLRVCQERQGAHLDEVIFKK